MGQVSLLFKKDDESNKYILLTKREVKMAGYWPSSLLIIKDLLYGIKSTEKNDLRTGLFSSTEKEPS